jgi:hypothetical protein
MKRFARFFIAALVGAGFFAAAPAVTASASSNVQATWADTVYSTRTFTYTCDAVTHTYNGNGLLSINNNCGDRIWLHEDLNGGGAQTYCVNPGATASGFSEIFTQFQITNNPNACDTNGAVYVNWDGVNTQYNCVQGASHTLTQNGVNIWIQSMQNHCNTRVWLHANPNGSGNAYCVNPFGAYTADAYNSYYQFSISANQALC